MNRNEMRAEYNRLDVLRKELTGEEKKDVVRRMRNIEWNLSKGQFIDATFANADIDTVTASSLVSGCCYRGATSYGVCISEGGYWKR